MGETFRDARLKIERANKHINDLEAAILSLKQAGTCEIQKDGDGGNQSIIHSVPNFDNALLDLSLIIGDAIHNLRSAVDFAWASVIERVAPWAVSSYNKFPVRDAREEVESALNGIKINSTNPTLFKIIVSDIQPYKRGQNHVIHTLHEWDIADKHLLLVELRPLVFIKNIVGRNNHGETFREDTWGINHSVGPFTINFSDDITIEDKGHLSVSIFVMNTSPFKNVPVVSLLRGFSNFVSHTVQALEGVT